ncbi:MAG: hypothetical protein JL50_07695 [Peptococcaceae bacterium BICA1-7]|nr:MAG: hypothetical protein JL50_07695 [Peptococcaceae bacterium BICA1-7]HBV97876.1 hypothetical protein [Desulfotomaculum sp.]
MRIAWFSPLPPLKSGISEYSEVILYHLKNRAEVHLWVDGFTPDPVFYKDFTVIDYCSTEEVLPLLKKYDAIVYNMGNNVGFHRGMYEIFLEYPGIVILHDYVLHHFIVGYWINKKAGLEGYFSELRNQYGPDLEESARKALRRKTPLWETDEVIKYPLNKNLLKRATGVIVHSEYVKMLVKDNVHDRVVKINSPVYPVPCASLNKKGDDLGLPEDKVILAHMGFLNPAKRMDTVMAVIAGEESLKKNIFLLIIGGSSNINYRLEEYAKSLGISENVSFLGYLPLEEAYAYLNCSHICLSLRYPTMGETSSSLIRIMSIGKPAVVTKAGWYDELPDNCVIKISPDNEAGDLKYLLTCLLSEKDAYKEIGLSAQKYIYSNFSTEEFVDGLLKFVSACRQFI